MFIQTEKTPNPETLKFLPGTSVLSEGAGGVEYKSEAESAGSPLARRLFEVAGVQSLFLGADFVSVTKDRKGNWDLLKPHIISAIMDHYMSGLPAVEILPEMKVADEFGSEIEAQIVELLETRVRPAVAQDGGDIVFDRFEDGVVYLHMRGACAGCPSSTMTLKAGIENMIKHFVPEVDRVEPA